MSDLKFVYQGSTKDIYQKGEFYLFKFSERYSVFDWGEMPDHISNKGKSLAHFTKVFYRQLQQEGIATHLIDQNVGEDEILVQPFEVIRDFKETMPVKENAFIPLEVIFRLGVAKGSSVLKRFKTLQDWKDAGFDRIYKESEFFSEPRIEFTTKLERFDRPLTHQEAKTLSGLSDGEWSDLLSITSKIALKLKDVFHSHDITLWDGKVEFACGVFKGEKREIILVDSIGPDELRLTKDGVQLSKEIIRQYYRKTDWYPLMEEAKTIYKEKFKDHISPPAKLPADFLSAIEEMYTLLPELIDGKNTSSARLGNLLTNLKASL